MTAAATPPKPPVPGAVSFALALSLWALVQEFRGFGPQLPAAPPAACLQPVALSCSRSARPQVACAEAAPWLRALGARAGDAVDCASGRCRRTPQGLAAAARLTLGHPLDLNRASLADLRLLPGIGPKLGRAILDHRSAHGRFSRPEALRAVRGIGPATWKRLAPLLAVSDP